MEDGRMNATAPQKREQETSRQDKKSEPLRILFCGSDEFSCASLRELHNEHVQNPTLIQSIDVVVRPAKGRGEDLRLFSIVSANSYMIIYYGVHSYIESSLLTRASYI